MKHIGRSRFVLDGWRYGLGEVGLLSKSPEILADHLLSQVMFNLFVFGVYSIKPAGCGP